jgi:serine O-acetyltransferase
MSGVTLSCRGGSGIDALGGSGRRRERAQIKPSFRRIRIALNSLRLLPHLALLLSIPRENVINTDISRWASIYHMPAPAGRLDLAWLFIAFMTFTPEFRNLFYLRVGRASWLISWLCPRLSTLQIDCDDIGPGLFIQHGIATLISAERIGANCWINQHVVIGFSSDTDRPRIGNGVRLGPGAKVIGGITVGDNATIGPNTVILADVEPGVTMLGVPGRVLWRASARPQ